MDESGTGNAGPPRERSREPRGRSVSRHAGQDNRPGGGSSSQRRLAFLEDQVAHLAGTLSSLGPVLQQALSLQTNPQAGVSSQIPPATQTLPPENVANPPAQPISTGAETPFAQPSQVIQPNVDNPNANTPTRRTSLGISTGSLLGEPRPMATIS